MDDRGLAEVKVSGNFLDRVQRDRRNEAERLRRGFRCLQALKKRFVQRLPRARLVDGDGRYVVRIHFDAATLASC